MKSEVEAIIQTTLQAKILEALTKDGTEYISTLVTSAMDLKVPDPSDTSRYSSRQIPFIEAAIQQQLQMAITAAVRTRMAEMEPEIKAIVTARLTADDVVDSFVKTIVGSTSQEWNVNVNFEKAE